MLLIKSGNGLPARASVELEMINNQNNEILNTNSESIIEGVAKSL